MKNLSKTMLFTWLVLTLSGCASVARGLGDSIFNNTSDQVRQCRVDGEAFDGLEAVMEAATPNGPNNTKTMRILFVHGIGEHNDHYSRPFVESVIRGLKLTRRAGRTKHIRMTRAVRTFDGVYGYKPGELGPLLITRYTNKDESRELLVFEVNWSEFSAAERKRLIEEDKPPKGFQAAVNGQVKTFFNKQVVDPIRYVGESSSDIRAYAREAFCWMVSLEWDDYKNSKIPKRSDENSAANTDICPVVRDEANSMNKVRDLVARDSFVAVTHSLGSRIFLDSFMIPDAGETENSFVALKNAFSEQKFTLIMLANQLPLLQLGLNDRGFPANKLSKDLSAEDFIPWENDQRYGGNVRDTRGLLPVSASAAELCEVSQNRRFKELSVITVSDPNDLLSYQLSEDYKNRYIDWALCPKFSDILIEVAQPGDIFGLEFSNPGAAHSDYWDDQGLANILLSGFSDEGQDRSAPLNRLFQPQLNHQFTALDRGRKIIYKCAGQLHSL